MKFYITMGQCHTHSVFHGGRNITVDKDSIVEVEAPDACAANEKAFELFGPIFSRVCEEPNLEFYPRGIVLSL